MHKDKKQSLNDSLYHQYKSVKESADYAYSHGSLREYRALTEQANDIWEHLEKLESEQGHS